MKSLWSEGVNFDVFPNIAGVLAYTAVGVEHHSV